MTTEPTVSILLNLEETGHLCHALMTKFLDCDLDIEHVDRLAPHEQRLLMLYHKLTEANDKLMGKT